MEEEDVRYLEKFNKLSYRGQRNVLWEALDYMNQYNGRSRHDCIVLVMKDIEEDIKERRLAKRKRSGNYSGTI